MAQHREINDALHSTKFGFLYPRGHVLVAFKSREDAEQARSLLIEGGYDQREVEIADSAKIADLTRQLAALARARIGDSEAPALTRALHRQQLEACLAALRAFLRAPACDVELRAEDLRQAATALGRITGRVDVEDVLDQIFARFCIGQ